MLPVAPVAPTGPGEPVFTQEEFSNLFNIIQDSFLLPDNSASVTPLGSGHFDPSVQFDLFGDGPLCS